MEQALPEGVARELVGVEVEVGVAGEEWEEQELEQVQVGTAFALAVERRFLTRQVLLVMILNALNVEQVW